MRIARNAAVITSALVLSILAIQPVLWFMERGERGRSYGPGVTGLFIAEVTSALPNVVAAIVFGVVTGLGIATVNPKRSALLVAITISLLLAASHRYVSPDFWAWFFVLAKIALSGVVCWAMFTLARAKRPASEAPSNSA